MKRKEYIRCSICKTDNRKTYFKKFGWNYVKCSNCGLIYVNPRLPEKETLTRYSRNYFIEEYLPVFNASPESYSLDKIKEHFFLYLELLDKYFAEGKKLLDVGCGAGFFLKAAQEKGWLVEGVDFSEEASRYAASVLDINVRVDKIETVTYPSEHFDVITMLDTIEHLRHPAGTLKNIYSFLKKDGILILNTPDFNSLSRVFLGKEWAVISPEEHLYNFTKGSLAELIKQAGFDVVIIQNLFYFNPDYSHNRDSRRHKLWKSLHEILKKRNIIEKLFSYGLVELMLTGKNIHPYYSSLKKTPALKSFYSSLNSIFPGDTLVAIARK